jgi:glycosyltransferase involved in cell wall biosynthesis
VDVERFKPRGEALNRTLEGATYRVVILFASRLLKEKGLTELVEAFRQVRKHHPSAELWIAGEIYPANPTSFSEAEITAMAQSEGIRLLGHVEDMPALLAKANIVALPSYREGTPKILLEAAACGLPIVATDVPGCRGVVIDGKNGYLVPTREIASLSDALGRMVADPQLRHRFGSNGRSIIEAGFSSESVVTRTLDVYATL